jgi:tetratricopeptide (TPR) repeat protein
MRRSTLRTTQVCIILALTLVGAIAFSEEITFESDVIYKLEGRTGFEQLKGSSPLKLRAGESALVSTSQGLSLLVYSPKNEKAQIKVSDADLNQLTRDQLRPALEKATNEIIEGLRKAESSIQRRDYDQALQISSALKTKYPSVSSILFTNATANYLTNNKAAAIEDLQKGLALDPNDAPATKLLKKLKEGS